MSVQTSGRVLVPVDFSKHSRAAALRACRLARASACSVELLHVLQRVPLDHEEPISETDWQALRRSEGRALERWCAELAPRGIAVRGVLEEGSAVEWVMRNAGQHDVELVVIGMHDFAGFERMYKGSVAEQMIHAWPGPIMLVKENEWDAAGMVRKILLATDFSESSEQALRLAIHWATRLNAEIEVMHAIEPGPSDTAKRDASSQRPGTARRSGEPRAYALRQLQAILARISAVGIRAGADLCYGLASIEIVKRAARSGADLVILGRRGPSSSHTETSRGGDDASASPGSAPSLQAPSRRPIGGVAERILRQAKCSVLIAPEKRQ